MHRFVITGGPCSGKTTIMSHLTQELEERGYKVIVVPESATELILSGIKPSEEISMLEFQNFVLALQMAKEDLFSHAQRYYNSDKVVVLCDRGVLDACAYVDKRNFEKLLTARGLTLAKVYSRYDAVLHLVTAAEGAEDFYVWNNPAKGDVGNNAARSESPAEARKKDKRTLNAWIGHPHLKMFDNSTEFDGKIQRVLAEVFSILGEPLPTEKERKYLIKIPTQNELKAFGQVSEAQIVQTYLTSNDEKVERRIRQRGSKDTGYSFYYTEKRDLGYGEREETEEIITATEYIAYLAEADTAVHQISKTRYCFMYEQHYFELDVYPFSDKYAILEVELANIKEKFAMPPLKVIREVTCDPNYRNYHLAKTLTLDHDATVEPTPAPKKREIVKRETEPAKVEKKPEPAKEEPKRAEKTEQRKVEKQEPKKQAPVAKPIEPKYEEPIKIEEPAMVEEPVKVEEPEVPKPSKPVKVAEPPQVVEAPIPQNNDFTDMDDLFGDGFAQEEKAEDTDDLFEVEVVKAKVDYKLLKNKTVKILEEILNDNGYTAKYDYCIGGMSEQKVCLQPTRRGWEVFVVEKGRKFDRSECADLTEAGIMMIRQLVSDRDESKEMIAKFKKAVGVDDSDKSAVVQDEEPETSIDLMSDDFSDDDLFDDFKPAKKQESEQPSKQTAAQKKTMSVEDFFSDLMN